MKAAGDLGIEVPEYRLFESKGQRYFGRKRFEVSSTGERFHLHSAAGLLHADFRLLALDYRDLLKLTSRLSKDKADLLKMYKLAVFHAVFHNRDDHVYSAGVGGEHTSSYLGEGRHISSERLLKLAKEFKINALEAKDLVERTKEVREEVAREFRGLGLSKHPLLSLP